MKGTYIEINLDNLKHNVKTIKEKYNNYDYYIAVVKGDAYGHGQYIANTLEKSGINYLAVSSLKEANDIRKYNKNIPILLLQPVPIEDLNQVTKNNLTLVIHELEYAKKITENLKDNLKIHLKIDSGMGRLGFTDKKDLKKCYDLLSKNKLVEIEGIYSHFATIGLFDKRWDIQLERFKDITSEINLKDIPIRHMASSATLINHPKIEFCNAVRSATLLYGYNISINQSNKGIKNKLKTLRNKLCQKKYNISKCYTNIDINVKKCMKFYTNILAIKEIKKGDKIGYGAKIKVSENTKIAILPLGYNNGIGTKNINRYVVIKGKRYNVLETSMNMTIIKIDDQVTKKDQVILMDNENITIGQLGRFADKHMHEIMLDIGKNNKRVYIEDKKIIHIEE